MSEVLSSKPTGFDLEKKHECLSWKMDHLNAGTLAPSGIRTISHEMVDLSTGSLHRLVPLPRQSVNGSREPTELHWSGDLALAQKVTSQI
jgi:hypothetical protein